MTSTGANKGHTLLQVRNLQAFYGDSQALHGVDLDVREGELVALLGRNGAGKTTTLRAIMGVVGGIRGSVRLRGFELVGLAPFRIGRMGIAYCPEERGIFSSLSVQENLLLPPAQGTGGMSLDEIYEAFPNLKERAASRGTKLSGGEQQMLAIARILRAGSRLLLLDEPTEGLAPSIVHRIGVLLRQLKARGYTILLVEQNFHFASQVADRFYVMSSGRVQTEFHASELPSRADTIESMLGV